MAYIDDLLTENGVDFIIKGSDLAVKCLSPDHTDTNPSMNIDRNTGRFHCFSCGYGGGVAKLMVIIGAEPPAQHMFLSLKIDRIKELIGKLRMEPPSMPETAVPYVGTYRRLSASTYEAHGAFTCNDPTWNYRLCFPVYDNYKKLAFIEARSTDEAVEPKYLRKPAGAEIDFLYNVNCGAPTVVLVEGWFDYLNLYNLGLRNVCPLFGLNFNKHMVKDVKLRGIQGVVIMLDNDAAGNAASSRIMGICAAKDLAYRRVVPNTDPGDIDNVEALAAMLKYGRCRLTEEFVVF